ncbi:MAG: hypothetical protein ACE5KV_05615, partial [Thermoplasmata archaeon]
MFERSVTVRSVAEKLECCRAEDDATDIKNVMQEKDFDVYGVEENGVVDGYVKGEELKTGECREYERTFHPSELIAESTPLMD